LKKARKAKLIADGHHSKREFTKATMAQELFELTSFAQSRGWCAEELLAGETKRRERQFRMLEQS